jgi:organic hydroperoxide reductase OsmC/OhrA
MSTHRAEAYWERGNSKFVDGRYSRRHLLRFANTVTVVGSASPSVVPAAYCEANAVDPEAAFVGSLSSCHMLWFLSLAAAAGFIVDDYRDSASGVLAPNDAGALAMTTVLLKPHVRFADDAAPDAGTYRQLHDEAHSRCFIARSVLSNIELNPTFELSARPPSP